MNKDTWSSLDPGTQKIWDSIDDKDKAAILNYASKRAEKRAAATKGAKEPKESRVANIHHQATGEDTDDDDEDGVTQSEPEMQANVTEQEANMAKGKAHPGDIRRVLGSSKPKKDVKPKARSTNHVMWRVNHLQGTDGFTASTADHPNLDQDAESSSEAGSISDPYALVDEYWGEQEDQFFP